MYMYMCTYIYTHMSPNRDFLELKSLCPEAMAKSSSPGRRSALALQRSVAGLMKETAPYLKAHGIS